MAVLQYVRGFNFKVSYKDTYKKRAPLAINRAPLPIDLLLHHWVPVSSAVEMAGIDVFEMAADFLEKCVLVNTTIIHNLTLTVLDEYERR